MSGRDLYDLKKKVEKLENINCYLIEKNKCCQPIAGPLGRDGRNGKDGNQGPAGPTGISMCWDEKCGNVCNGVYAQWTPKNGPTGSIVLTPKGNGFYAAQVPDNTVVGGNCRGINAVDWQIARDDASQVASGDYSVIPGGFGNTASGEASIAMGYKTQSNGFGSLTYGHNISGIIAANGAGSTAYGYTSATGSIQTGDSAYGSNAYGCAIESGSIQTGNTAYGSNAHGFSYRNAIIQTGDTAIGSNAHGFADTNAKIQTGGTANGSNAYGYASATGSIQTGDNAYGSNAYGSAANGIIKTGYFAFGSNAYGIAGSGTIQTGDIAFGSNAHGTVFNNGIIQTGLFANGSNAQGFAEGGTIQTGNNAFGAIAAGHATVNESVGAYGQASFAFGRDVVTNNNHSMIIGQFGTALNSATGTLGITGPSGSSVNVINGIGSLQIAGGSDNANRDISVVIGTSIFGGFAVGGGIADFWHTNGADYAEYFEWSDGNLNRENRIGYFVSIDPNKFGKIKIASSDSGDKIIGIVSSNNSESGYIGDSAEMKWHDAKLRDKYGRILYRYSYANDIIEILQKSDIKITSELQSLIKNNDPMRPINQDLFNDPAIESDFNNLMNSIKDYPFIVKEKSITPNEQKERSLTPEERDNLIIQLVKATYIKVTIPNPNYDSSQGYVSRANRPEWTPVSLLGKVRVRDNGQCIPGQYCDHENGIAVPGSKWIVLSRIDSDIIRILLINQ